MDGRLFLTVGFPQTNDELSVACSRSSVSIQCAASFRTIHEISLDERYSISLFVSGRFFGTNTHPARVGCLALLWVRCDPL